ncbi:MAG: RNA-binding S4 domain-containing protein [bacterium]
MQSLNSEQDKSIRLDKWLKISRIFKTRALATRACEEGKVKVNDKKSKPARMIKISDKINIKIKSNYRTYEVLDIVYKSISKKDAKLLYHEHVPQLSEESKELYELLQEWDREGKRKFKGRPTKKERRQLDKLKRY